MNNTVYHQGQKAADVPFTTWSWTEYRAKVDAFAKSLLSLGFEPFDIINIIGFNSREWFTANFGAMAAGGVAAGIYATNLADSCKYISGHSKAKVVVCEGVKQLEKYYEIGKDLPDLKALVMYGPDELTAEIKDKCPVPAYTFEEFLELGKDVPDADVKARTDALQPNSTCTLIYTSGTTGPPKAVMITHDNLTWTVQAMLKCVPGQNLYPTDCLISYLPLSHIAAQMLDMHTSLQTGLQIYFAQPDALKGSLGVTLKEVKPTIFFGVPRVWEKIYGKAFQAKWREKIMLFGKRLTVRAKQTKCRRLRNPLLASRRSFRHGRRIRRLDIGHPASTTPKQAVQCRIFSPRSFCTKSMLPLVWTT